MSDQHGNGWTLAAYVAHNEALRTADEKFHVERDRRYAAIDGAHKAALEVALKVATKADEKTEAALKEYKTGANEWRDTVKDLIAIQQGTSRGMKDMWGWLIAAAVIGVELFRVFAR